jgi:DNA-binding winged helix-turn-helix (wHTH) protein/Tfp pilus assembly protein PilF
MENRPGSLFVANFAIDLEAGVLRRCGRRIDLRPKAWALLEFLARHPGRLCSRGELKEQLWPGLVVVDDSLTQCVVELRRALGDQEHSIVRTVARRGYRFDGVRGEFAGEVGVAWESLRSIAGPQRIEAARQVFERAYCEREGRAEALAGISLSHVIQVLNRWSCAPSWQVRIAREAAREALGLDDRLAIAHHAAAHVAMLEGRDAEAEAGFLRALACDPQLTHAQVRLAVIAIERGRAADAAPLLDAASAKAVSSPTLRAQICFVRGMAQFHIGQEAAALVSMDDAIMLQPSSPFPHQWKAAICALQRNDSLAFTHLERFRALVPGHTLESLQATERSSNPQFLHERRRFYDGLHCAGMPQA